MGFRDDHRAAIEQLGTRSVILVPFCNHVVDGVILMASSQRSYDADDLALAEDYRERVANALTNARLYSRSLAALRARDEFLRVASHELRTPLTALQFACERLASASHGVTRDMAATAERALRASRRLGRLVTHMLEAVEVEQQRPTIEPARVDLVPVVREAVGDLLQTKRGSVVVELALPDKLVGEWDDDRVQEIVINLVDNALRYGNGEPVRVELDRDGGDAVLAVADHGPGIAPELLPNLFEPYERGPANAHAGLGLGLFIVKQLVDAQHGSIDVRSRPGEGARFTVRLPGAT
jgi:signal transduction histidine kinase